MKRHICEIAMILAAGRGQRLRPVSDAFPKPAIPLPGGPLIRWPLRLAAGAGMHRAVVNTWWLAPVLEATARTVTTDGLEVVFSRELSLMDTAGGLALARDRGLLGDTGSVVVINGDGLLNLDLTPLFVRHLESADLVTLALIPHLDPHRWSRVVLDNEARVTDIKPKGSPEAGEVPLLYPGVMVVSRSALNALPSEPSPIPKTLWAPAQTAGRLGGVVVSGHWRELGTPGDYLDATMTLLGDGKHISPDASVHDTAKVVRSFIGRDAQIAADAVIGESIVGCGARIAAGCRVFRSILLGPVQTAPGETLAHEHRCLQKTSQERNEPA